ncbi:uncharacterized protein BO80DRAFT_442603 [Aspergillus ibericus CBS 121593]|uniref:Peptidase S8/S53 domain-containing protein n=1 Tax=Aspergillus ibericus CBS 121593 TaxID=1448316 RepID=A0A395H9B5_9EURO|nr:hypothetical protein BO80DRAFT_442603 [Aspergillus ibericus CBS 121593]RAL03478.1 hypothetical protein BO80DRAFT_442603 [Aspergillus ibericus CBS 121593]
MPRPRNEPSNPKSAAKAINHAIDSQADIISMSWSPSIIRLGGPKQTGQIMDQVGSPNNVDYTCPGDGVSTERWGPGEIRETHSLTGSSVATALAAGLAALILYCAQVRLALSEGEERPTASASLGKLRTPEGMRTAFDTMRNEDRYLAVWKAFGKTDPFSSSRVRDDVVRVATTLSP